MSSARLRMMVKNTQVSSRSSWVRFKVRSKARCQALSNRKWSSKPIHLKFRPFRDIAESSTWVMPKRPMERASLTRFKNRAPASEKLSETMTSRDYLRCKTTPVWRQKAMRTPVNYSEWTLARHKTPWLASQRRTEARRYSRTPHLSQKVDRIKTSFSRGQPHVKGNNQLRWTQS